MENEHQLYIEKPGISLKRAFIFFDHANVFHNLQELKVRIDYDLVKAKLAKGYYLVAPIMYLGKPRVVYPKKQKFFDALVKKGWSITEKPLKIHSSGKKSQNGLDDEMFLNIYDFAKEGAYDKAIIVSGDSVFVGVAKALKKLKIDIDLWSFQRSISQALIKEVGSEHIYYIDDIMEEITLKDTISESGDVRRRRE